MLIERKYATLTRNTLKPYHHLGCNLVTVLKAKLMLVGHIKWHQKNLIRFVQRGFWYQLFMEGVTSSLSPSFSHYHWKWIFDSHYGSAFWQVWYNCSTVSCAKASWEIATSFKDGRTPWRTFSKPWETPWGMYSPVRNRHVIRELYRLSAAQEFHPTSRILLENIFLILTWKLNENISCS